MAWAHAGLYDDNIRTASGANAASTLVTINLQGTQTAATLYADRNYATPIANPVSTDSLGNLKFYATPGLYTATANSGSFDLVVNPDPADLPASASTVQLGGDLGGTGAAPQVIGTHLASPLPLAQGGTGQATQQAALNTLAGGTTSGQYLRGNGTNVGLSAIQAADVPTLNQNTTGTASNITATLDQVPAPAANVGMASHKITSLANGSAATDAAAFGQIPTALPPNGTASGDLGGSYPGPTVTATHLASPLPVAQGGTGSATQNFVDLTTGQSVGGTKTFTGEVVVPTPVNSGDAVTKAYADAIAQGLSVKPSAQEATTTALPANTYSASVLTATANGALVVDGITVASGDRVLVQNEATASHNGVYTVTNPGSGSVAYVLTRASDMNTGSQVPGAFVFVEQGTVNAGSGFVVASPGPFTIGTTAITWTQFSGAGEITAGTGLSKAGNTLTLSVPVAVANGGTASTTATAARTALQASMGLVPVAVQTGAYSANPGDFVPVSTASGNVTVTLPSAPADRTMVAVKMVAKASSNTVTVACSGSDVFNVAGGAATLTLTLLNQGAYLQYQASTGLWYILSDDLPLSQLDKRYGPNVYSVFMYGAVGDYSTDDTTAINAAIAACSAAGGGVVLIGQHVVSGSGVIPASNVTLQGVLGYSKLKNSTNNNAITSSSITAASNIAFRDFTIEGPVNQTVTQPTHARTTSGNGTTIGIYIDGSLDTTVTAPAVTNVVIENVTVQNCTSLPIRIFGVTGRVLVTDCSFYNCLDAGFGFNQEVIVSGCHSLLSGDNGLSISRGNAKVTCVNNTVELCARYGIWLSGFTGTAGPTTFSCAGNTVLNSGLSSIVLMDAPKFGNVTGNMLTQGYWRGATDQPTDDACAGIEIRGNSTTPSSPGTTIAYGLKVAKNTIAQAARAGVLLSGATGTVVEGNGIYDCGTQFLSDGVTAIAANSTSQNVGVLIDYTTALFNCVIRNNDVIDSRATPYCNLAVYPAQVSGVVMVGNTMVGCRNSTTVPVVLDAWNDQRVAGGQATMDRRLAQSTNNITMSSGVCRFAYFTAQQTATIASLRVSSAGTGAGATPTLVRFALYSVDASGNLTQMSSTASDTSIFATNGTAYTRTLTAAQQIIAGQLYAIGVIVVTAATAPTVAGCIPSIAPSEMSLSPRLAGTLTGQSDLPASVTAGSVAATQSMLYAVAVYQ